MPKIQVLGTGCPKCEKLTENVQAAIDALGSDHEIEKITDVNEIMTFGVMLTPALAVDGDVKVSGRVAKVQEIKDILSE